MFSLGSALLVLSSLCLGAATVLLFIKFVCTTQLRLTDEYRLVDVALVALWLVAGMTWFADLHFLLVLMLAVGSVGLFRVLARHYHSISPIGLFFYIGGIGVLLVVPLWMTLFLLQIEVSTLTRMLLMLSVLPISFLFPFSILQLIEQFDVLCRTVWHCPREVRPLKAGETEPFVSIHIPTYAEPPELVIATIERVLQLAYTNYEILVIDNNTKDEDLWRPLEAFCHAHRDRVRFFHFDTLAGAKAGALNFASTVTDNRAEIISVIDADYHPRPTFLRDLVKHFADPFTGFVQTPHDYRDWDDNLFLEMCYFEYKAFFHTVMVGLNEKRSGLTVGTMCLIRKNALLAAGGWSTWCVTEDSELAIRIHELGYESVYVPQAYGFGLIPERFHDFAKQRYRWVAGPVQELKHHFRLFLWPNYDSQLSFLQRLHHFNHGLGSMLFGLQIPLLGLTILAVVSMVVHQEVVAVPLSVWLAATVQVVSSFILQYIIYTRVVGTTVWQMILATITNKALLWTMQLAALTTILNQKQSWRRTNKFKQQQTIWGALGAAQLEIVLSVGLIGFAITMFILLPYPGFATMILLGLVFRGSEYFMTPVLAVISVRSQAKADAVGAPNPFAPQPALQASVS